MTLLIVWPPVLVAGGLLRLMRAGSVASGRSARATPSRSLEIRPGPEIHRSRSQRADPAAVLATPHRRIVHELGVGRDQVLDGSVARPSPTLRRRRPPLQQQLVVEL